MAVLFPKVGSPRRAQKGLGGVARLVQSRPHREQWLGAVQVEVLARLSRAQVQSPEKLKKPTLAPPGNWSTSDIELS